jgi:hypothetical protein
MKNKLTKPLSTDSEHSALDLYFQAVRTSQELQDISDYISTRKKSMDLVIARFKHIHNVDENLNIETETFWIKLNTNAIKAQIKAYKKYLRKILNT